ncbi:MAG: CDP-glycerol glycerophosphotransferase family protein [Myxococcales bacterium]|nr:CDP-glycerol glycerophosphotransferase family protein [Myxococcales bacterium]
MGLLSDAKALRRFHGLAAEERRLVFYAESRADWPHFRAVLAALESRWDRPIPYLTSDPQDPVLSEPGGQLRPFCIGSGVVRTWAFQAMRADVLALTLPDLQTYQLKRSVHGVHYAYLQHSLNSTHRVYRRGAFDHYDTIFCAGPHHTAEVRRTEEVYGLPHKALVEHGYGRLDAILERAADREVTPRASSDAKEVLLAPSWGECSFIEAPCGRELLRALLSAGHRLTLRLHPMTVRRMPQLASELSAELAPSGRFVVETDMDASKSLAASDLMVSDWSGAASEYAFGLEKPVLFIDTPAKINNPEHDRIDLPPLEKHMRSEIGRILAPSEVAEAARAVAQLCADANGFARGIREARNRWVFNVGRSGEVGAEALLSIVAANPG